MKRLFLLTCFILFVWGVFFGTAWLIFQGLGAIINAVAANFH
jgi:hypothetical protein